MVRKDQYWVCPCGGWEWARHSHCRACKKEAPSWSKHQNQGKNSGGTSSKDSGAKKAGVTDRDGPSPLDRLKKLEDAQKGLGDWAPDEVKEAMSAAVATARQQFHHSSPVAVRLRNLQQGLERKQ
eukprot:1641605-Amphidinium_carterae.1